MIGLIRFASRGRVAAAVLEDDGSWSCDALPWLIRPLAFLYSYSPNWDGLPAGRRLVRAAALRLNGTVVFEAGRFSWPGTELERRDAGQIGFRGTTAWPRPRGVRAPERESPEHRSDPGSHDSQEFINAPH